MKHMKMGLGIRVGIILSTVLFVIMGCKIIYDAFNSYKSAIEQGENIKISEARKLVGDLEGRFIQAYTVGDAMLSVTENVISKQFPDKIDKNLLVDSASDLIKKSNYVSGMGIYFDGNSFNGKEAFSKYVYKENGSVKVMDEDATGKDWYKSTMAEKQVNIIEPYIDTDGTMYTSYTFPITRNENVLGVLLVDIEISDIQDWIKSVSSGIEDFKGLLTGNGVFVANAMDDGQIMQNLFENVPEAKKNVETSFQNGFQTSVETISGTNIPGKIVYVPVNIKGVDKPWCLESITSMRLFLWRVRKDLIVDIILNIFIIAVISGISMLVIKKMVTNPLNIVLSAINKLADQNLDISGERELAKKYNKNNDEIGDVMKSLGLMVRNLTDMVKSITEISQNTAATAEELSATSQSTSASASDVAVAVANIAEGATSQAADTQSAAESVEKSDEHLEDMLNMLKELAKAIDAIGHCKDDGNATLKELIKITEDTGAISKQVRGVIDETNSSAERISRASEMIQSISDQTALLALNASIEAARAGETGRGFAVVASEIGKLAEESAGFTSEIGNIISELRVKSESAVVLMEDTQKMVSEQSQKVGETNDKFEEISKAVENSKSVVESVELYSNDVYDENQNVIRIVENLSAIAEENAATTEEASASVDTQVQAISNISDAAEQLAEIATSLQNKIAMFKL